MTTPEMITQIKGSELIALIVKYMESLINTYSFEEAFTMSAEIAFEELRESYINIIANVGAWKQAREAIFERLVAEISSQ